MSIQGGIQGGETQSIGGLGGGLGGQQSSGISAGGGINLKKGQRVDLTKGNANLDKIHVGLGWDTNDKVGSDFDLDASVFMVGENGLVPTSKNFIYFNNLVSPCGSVKHMGDNLTGEGDGDDEEIKIQLSLIPQEIQKIIFTVSIYEALSRGQNFGQVENSFIRILDENTGKEVIRYDLTEDFSSEQSMIVGELYRHGAEWKFSATGAGYVEEIGGICKRYGC